MAEVVKLVQYVYLEFAQVLREVQLVTAMLQQALQPSSPNCMI